MICEKTALKGMAIKLLKFYPHIKILIMTHSKRTVTIVPTALVDSSKKLSDIIFGL
jgi:hypothetical protein